MTPARPEMSVLKIKNHIQFAFLSVCPGRNVLYPCKGVNGDLVLTIKLL